MGKKRTPSGSISTKVGAGKQPEAAALMPEPKVASWLRSFRFQAVIVALVAFGFYINTIRNEQALDDYMVIVKNEYVYEGLAGLEGIFTKDAYYSYFRQFNTVNQLSGGRYRPLSIATFAIEQQFFGAVPKHLVDTVLRHTDWGEMQGKPDPAFLAHMHIRHFFNVLLFTLSVVVLLYFLRYVVLSNNPVMAFLAAILFAIHPIHTEVVANVKSRDEILSLLFVCATFIFAFRSEGHREKKWLLYAGLISYFLAFLSKEYAIGLVVLLPISFVLFCKYTFGESLLRALPYFGVAFLYVVIRQQIVVPANNQIEADVVNNPYAYATAAERLATELYTPLNYLKLLLFPHPLSADYSYGAIPYRDFSDPLVWLSIAVHSFLVWGFFYFRKRNGAIAFAIGFYLVNLLLVSNLIFDIGAAMGERLIFHSSVGFSIVAACVLIRGATLLKSRIAADGLLAGCTIGLVVLCAFKTIDRNKDWKNDVTLFTHDIKVVPNSILINSNVAAYIISNSENEKDSLIRHENLLNGIKMLNKVISLNKNNATSYFNKCVAFKYLNEPDSIVSTLTVVSSIYPNYPQLADLYFQAGQLYMQRKEYEKAGVVFQSLQKAFPGNADIKNALQAAGDSLRAAIP